MAKEPCVCGRPKLPSRERCATCRTVAKRAKLRAETNRNCRYCGTEIATKHGPAACPPCSRKHSLEYHRALNNAAKVPCACGGLKEARAKLCRQCTEREGGHCPVCKAFSVDGALCRFCAMPELKRPHNQGAHCPPTCHLRGRPHSHCRGDGREDRREASCGEILPANVKQCDVCAGAQKRRELREAGAKPYQIDRHRVHPTALATLSREELAG